MNYCILLPYKQNKLHHLVFCKKNKQKKNFHNILPRDCASFLWWKRKKNLHILMHGIAVTSKEECQGKAIRVNVCLLSRKCSGEKLKFERIKKLRSKVQTLWWRHRSAMLLHHATPTCFYSGQGGTNQTLILQQPCGFSNMFGVTGWAEAFSWSLSAICSIRCHYSWYTGS